MTSKRNRGTAARRNPRAKSRQCESQGAGRLGADERGPATTFVLKDCPLLRRAPGRGEEVQERRRYWRRWGNVRSSWVTPGRERSNWGESADPPIFAPTGTDRGS